MGERQYRIHPAVGIARVGDAVRSDTDTSFYFIGPEFPDVPANCDPKSGVYGEFKTSDGRIKPQAARFRIFEFEKGNDGKLHPLGEVKTSDTTRMVKITWTVHLANRKPNFCEFHGQAGAKDPHLVNGKSEPFFFLSFSNNASSDLKVRNFALNTTALRKKWLELDVGPLSVNGGDTAAVAHFQIDRKNKVNDGSKLKITTLGELRSDNDGHLIVIGGMGRSDFDPGLGNSSIGHFANNDCWFDDVSDGPVDATLTIDGVAHPVSGAWVAVGPPDFVPAIRSYRTLYDSLIDVIVREMEIPADDGLFAGSDRTVPI